MVATAVVGSAAIGAGASIFGANKAAKAQAKAAKQASATQMAMFNKMQENMQPYMEIGKYATGLMNNKLEGFLQPITMDQETLEKTPGYQFTKNQGLKAVQNSAAARGLGSSGAAMKGAANFVTGLADNTYSKQFELENINRTNAYNRLTGVMGTGQNAAAGVGNAAMSTGQQIGQNQIGIGNAKAGSYMAMGNAIGGLANTVGGYAMSQGMYGNGGTTNNFYNVDPNASYSTNMGMLSPSYYH